jgi:hypothetical protein
MSSGTTAKTFEVGVAFYPAQWAHNGSAKNEVFSFAITGVVIQQAKVGSLPTFDLHGANTDKELPHGTSKTHKSLLAAALRACLEEYLSMPVRTFHPRVIVGREPAE